MLVELEVTLSLQAEVDQRSLDDMQRGEVRIVRSASFSQPLAKLARFFERTDAAGAGEREGNERVGRAVSHKRSLQRRLFSQIEREQKTEFHPV